VTIIGREKREQTVERWQAAVEGGYASRACDIIVSERQVPSRLLVALFWTDEPVRRANYEATVWEPRSDSPLSRRQQEVVMLMAAGRTVGEAAKTLGCGYETARRHLRNAGHKVGVPVRTTTQLVAVCIRRSFV
jgi:DNA-binding CsgD family transcriptional regulator